MNDQEAPPIATSRPEVEPLRVPDPDLLHPNGRCTCADEGQCDWCVRPCPSCQAPAVVCECPEAHAPLDPDSLPQVNFAKPLPPRAVGQHLRELRTRLRVTLGELASQSEFCSVSDFSRLERTRESPWYIDVNRYLKALGSAVRFAGVQLVVKERRESES